MIIIENQFFLMEYSMPRYDFKCEECHKRFSLYISYQDYGKKKARCTFCGSENTSRCISWVRVARSEEARLENFSDLSDPDSLNGLEENPRELGRMMRKMSGETGENIGPEFNEVVERLEHGQSPEDIERDLPDLESSSDKDFN